MPHYHAAGASKAVRRECFENIGGFITQRGWDTVDEIRARSRGWETTHFADLKMKHWKPEGTGMGLLRTSCMHGEIYYRTGGSRPVLYLKSRAPNDAPPLRGGSHRSPLGIPKGNGQTKTPPRHRRGSALLSSALEWPDSEQTERAAAFRHSVNRP